MPEIKSTAAELRAQADLAEVKEYWEQVLAKQRARIVSIKERIAARQLSLKAAETRLAAVEKEFATLTPAKIEAKALELQAIRRARVGLVASGGTAITVPTGTVKTEGK